MDAHVIEAPLRETGRVHALTALWNRNVLACASQGVFSYDERLKLLSAHLQQVVMESLGKSVHLDGTRVDEPTVPVWWGGAGTDVQHSFFQALHQGTDITPGDFVGVVRADHPYRESHRALFANLLAQTEAFANGQGVRIRTGATKGIARARCCCSSAHARSLGVDRLYEHSVYLHRSRGTSTLSTSSAGAREATREGRYPPCVDSRGNADPVTRALLDQINAIRDPRAHAVRAPTRLLAHHVIFYPGPRPQASSTSGVVGASQRDRDGPQPARCPLRGSPIPGACRNSASVPRTARATSRYPAHCVPGIRLVRPLRELVPGTINWQDRIRDRLPINGRARERSSCCSIVRYEMHRRASSRLGATIACVGQMRCSAARPAMRAAGASTATASPHRPRPGKTTSRVAIDQASVLPIHPVPRCAPARVPARAPNPRTRGARRARSPPRCVGSTCNRARISL